MSYITTDASEYDAIADVFQPYLNGALAGKGDDMKSAFHKDATIFGYVGDDLFAGPIQQLFEWTDATGPSPQLDALIASINVTATAATARLEIDNWTGKRFTDLFTLLKVDGKWKIMNKVFHLHPDLGAADKGQGND